MKARTQKKTAPRTPKAKRGRKPARPVKAQKVSSRTRMVPGEYLLRSEPITANAGATAISIEVANAGDRPVQVGSHFHFFEVNSALDFDRASAYGTRLNIPAGTAVRFEPGQRRRVSLIPLGGCREVWGLNGLVNGALRS